MLQHRACQYQHLDGPGYVLLLGGGERVFVPDAELLCELHRIYHQVTIPRMV